jgi:hypothetical protein
LKLLLTAREKNRREAGDGKYKFSRVLAITMKTAPASVQLFGAGISPGSDRTFWSPARR